MLDRKFILDNLDAVRANCHHRGVKVELDRLVELDGQRKAKAAEVQELNRQANEVSKSIGQAKDAAEREARKEEGRRLREFKDAAQAAHDALEEACLAVQKTIPNMAHPAAPIGGDDQSNLEVRRGKHAAGSLGFKALDHVELGKQLDLIDFEGGARTTGAGFYFIKNEAVLLDLALQRFAIGELMKRGFVPTITPDLASNTILEGIGFMPRGPETQVYSIEKTDLSLVGTAEITLGGLYSGHVFEREELPLRLCGISHCYRTEAGAAGRASRGLYRVHQFTKVEMFAYSLPEQSDEILEQFCAIECELFDALEIPYRVVDTATGDLGGPAYRKFDLEAWMPGRGESGEYGEVTSTSNCTDYQSRRLDIRYRVKGEKGTHFVHTLNGTAIALSRALIAVIENHQRADGSISIPAVLRPYMGMDVIAAKG